MKSAVCGATLFLTVLFVGPFILAGGLMLKTYEEVAHMIRMKCKGKKGGRK